MMKIAVDAMGGDHAPANEVQGAIQAANELGVGVVLVGAERQLHDELRKHGWRGRAIEVVDATEVITMSEPVAQAVRRKRNSSVHVAAKVVADGRAAGLVSAGNTGAVMGVAMIKLGSLASVDRPALATVLPTVTGKGALMLDVGANAECKPEHLMQFAVMGAIYAREVIGIPNPRVGLLSIGEEEVKGNDLTKEAHKLLKAAPVRFTGNVEGRQIFSGDVDVIVCDGFTGNVALKTLEGTIRSLLVALRSELESTTRGKLGGLLIRPAASSLRARLDPETTGGGYLLGLRGIVVIAHGSSSRVAISNAIALAGRGIEHDIVSRLQQTLPERVVESSRSTNPSGTTRG